MSTQDEFGEALDFLSFGGGSAPPGQPGDRIGDYRLVTEIGRGGGGVVFEAVQRSLGRRVALKILHGHAEWNEGDGEATVEPHLENESQQQREAILLASLEHPHLVKVYDTGVDGQRRWVTMQLIEGCSLAHLIAGKVPELPKPDDRGWHEFLLPRLTNVADALAAAHDAGVSHGDLKPSNVLLDHGGHAFLTDFGLASRKQEDPSDESATRPFRGTPRYASPEQARGASPDPRGDAFSFGLLMFTCLNGKPAFEGNTTREVLHQIQHSGVKWANPDRIPRDLRAVVEKCLEKHPRDRYANAGEIAAELRRFTRFAPVEARPHGRLQRWVRLVRHRPKSSSIIAALIGVTLVAALAFYQMGNTKQDLGFLEDRGRMVEVDDLWNAGTLDRQPLRPEFLTLAERDAVASILLGDVYLVGEDWAAAERAYHHALSLSDALPFLHLRLALAAHHLNGTALPPPPAREPTNAREAFVLACYLEELAAPTDALDVLRANSASKAGSFPLMLKMASLMRATLQHKSAVRTLERAVGLHPQRVEFVHLLAHEYRALNLLDDSYGLGRRFQVTLESQDPLVLADMALAMLMRGDGRAAQSLTKRAAASEGCEQPWVISVRARVIALANPGNALQLLDDALENHGAIPCLLEARGLVAIDVEDWTTVETMSDALLAHEELDWQVAGLALDARLDRLREEPHQALEDYLQLAQLDPECPAWPLQLADIYHDLGQLDEAETWIDRSTRLDSAGIEGLMMKAQILTSQGRAEDAIGSATRAFGLNSKNPEAAYRVGATWLAMDEPKAALPFLARAIRFAPDNQTYRDAYDEAWSR